MLGAHGYERHRAFRPQSFRLGFAATAQFEDVVPRELAPQPLVPLDLDPAGRHAGDLRGGVVHPHPHAA